ncbi:MAG: hypothetical protein H0X62_00660 [Bacteroidetes bacterium]|nr:hypothetical protein [Bacteroidota bacterium]
MKTINRYILVFVIIITSTNVFSQEHPQQEAAPTISYDENEIGEYEPETSFDEAGTENTGPFAELIEFQENLDTMLNKIKEDMTKLDHQLIRISEKVALAYRKEKEDEAAKAPPVEESYPGYDDFYGNNESEMQEELAPNSEEVDTVPATPETTENASDYNKIRELEEEKRDLVYSKQELFVKRDRFKESVRNHNFRDAQRFKAGIEFLMDDIINGIHAIREELHKFDADIEG